MSAACSRALSRDDRAAAIDGRPLADHQLVRVIGLLADVLEQLSVRLQKQNEPTGEWCRVGSGIVDRQLVPQRVEVDARKPFERAKLGRVRQAAPIEPEAFVETNRVYDERVAFPVTDRMAVVIRLELRWMRPPVRIDRPESVGPTDIEDVDALEFRNLDNLHAVGRQEHSRATRWLAPRVRFERIRSATGVQGPRPRLEGKVRFRGHAKWVRNERVVRQPHTLL